jgi:dihydroorotase
MISNGADNSDRNYELVLKGGTVIDPVQGLHSEMDVALKAGKIAAIQERLNTDADRSIDVTGRLVVAGLIDLHTHVFWGGNSLSINPDALLKRSGVTTWVDAGSAGAGNFSGFYEFVIKTSRVRIIPFLNIAFGGIFGFMPNRSQDNPVTVVGEICDLRLAHLEAAVDTATEFADIIVGMKIRAGVDAGCGFPGIEPVLTAKKAAETIGKPLMVHIGASPPTTADLLSVMDTGDILTHCFRDDPNSLLDKHGKVLTELSAARQRGVLLDLGHGAGSFSFEATRKMRQFGIEPDVISSDLHAFSVNGPAYDLPTTMSKMLNLGMPLDRIVQAVTHHPAKAIGFEQELGSLEIGTTGDITVLEYENGEFLFQDCFGNEFSADKRLVPVMTIKGGEIVD